MMTKHCVICGREFKAARCHSEQKTCDKECRYVYYKLQRSISNWDKKYRTNSKKAIRQSGKLWYEKNKEEILKKGKVWRQTSPNYKLYRKARRYGTGTRLSVVTVQKVYEDNIKKYGTLTCILCVKPIKFGEDSLEHKQPLCREGSNEYENLGIAHKSCNYTKRHMTMEEWFKYKEKIC